MATASKDHGLSSVEISRAIGLSRIVLIIGLVFLHYGTFPNSLVTPFHGLDTDSHRFATWVNSAILFFFFSAVPLLSMVSGWLFFSFADDDAWQSLRQRIHRRFVSLYLPLVVWNAAYFSVIYALFVANPHASTFTHTNRLNINFSGAGWMEYVNAVFAVTDTPIAFQFWFVRDLFVTTLVSPVLWLMLKRAPWPSAAILCLIWLSGSKMGIFFRPDVPFFFYLGALVRRKRLSMIIPLRTTLLLVALYVILVCVRALAPYAVDFNANGDAPLWLDAATRAMRIPGVLGCWGVIYRLAQTQRGGVIGSYGGLAFFLHSAHWPLLAVIKVGLWRFMPGDNDLWMLIHYAASIMLTIMVGLGLGLGLAYKVPRLFTLMNGGRLLGQWTDRIASAPAECDLPNPQRA